MRLWRLFRPRPEPASWAVQQRREPFLDTVPYVPPPAPPPRTDGAPDHYPPLGHKLGLFDTEAAPFAGELLPGDEVWDFFSPPQDWRAKAGRAGVALVRDGKVVRSIVTILN